MTAGGFRPVHFPALTAGAPVQRDDERSDALITHEHDQVIYEDRRRCHAIGVGERPELVAPALATAAVVREHAEILKEHVHVAAVGHRRR